MFHTGDLQSGIALAVQNMKAVVCFVRGELVTVCYAPGRAYTDRSWKQMILI